MATYKVPQDVEADDKLIGPFSFRQFIYLIIVVLAGAMAWGLAQLTIVLAVIPVPIIIFFGALALPLRKDQPMEIYMAAMVSFYLKPRKRLWDPEGVETLIEITAPKSVDENRTKGLSQQEAQQRLGYLATIVDSGGWAIRGAGAAPSTSINNDVFLEAQGAVDVLDTNNSVAQSFNQMMADSTAKVREEAVERMKTAMFEPEPAPIFNPAPVLAQTPQSTNTLDPMLMQFPAPAPIDNSSTKLVVPEFDPYPTNIQQTVIQPLNDPYHMAEQNIEPVITPQPAVTAQQTTPWSVQSSASTSGTPIAADIIKLANNADGLSIETVAHEANRIQRKIDQDSEEVVISLR